MGQALGSALITPPALPALPPVPIPAILPSNDVPKAHLEALPAPSSAPLSSIENINVNESQIIPLQNDRNQFEREDPLGLPDNQLVKIIQDCEQVNEELVISQPRNSKHLMGAVYGQFKWSKSHHLIYF